TEYQEARGIILDDSDGDWPADDCPWLPLRWSYVAGEDYGRGLIEAIYKDVKKYDELSEALGDAAKNAAKLIWMTQGGGAQALVNRLSKAKSGDFVAGDREQVKALQQEKANDLQVAFKQHEQLKGDLSLIFLLGTALQRGGDRVTKFEVEYLARELEAVYSNEYTIIGREFQEPYFKAKTAQLRRRGVIAALPPKALKVQITTGIDALGRGTDQSRLETLGELAKNASQLPSALINAREYLRRSAANLAVKPDGLIPSEEEASAMEQRAQQAAMVQQLAPEMARGVSQSALQQQAAALEQRANSPTPPTPGEPPQ
ncbi:MAG TPA: portal protein, partial [Archangium sp.]